MLDPRSLDERRNEIAESARRRGVALDIDGAVAAQRAAAALQTELNDANRLRNEHQEAGKRVLSPEEREAHTAEGRRRKEEVAALEADIARMKAKHSASRAERKGRLQARIDSLHEKLRHALDRAKAERDAIKREDAAKVQ